MKHLVEIHLDVHHVSSEKSEPLSAVAAAGAEFVRAVELPFEFAAELFAVGVSAAQPDKNKAVQTAEYIKIFISLLSFTSNSLSFYPKPRSLLPRNSSRFFY